MSVGVRATYPVECGREGIEREVGRATEVDQLLLLTGKNGGFTRNVGNHRCRHRVHPMSIAMEEVAGVDFETSDVHHLPPLNHVRMGVTRRTPPAKTWKA